MRLTDLPDHLLDDVAAHLPAVDRLRMDEVPNRGLQAAIALQVHAARLQHEAPELRSLNAFLQALNGDGEGTETAGSMAVAALPHRLQVEPLLALGARIVALPAHERDAAAAAWAAFPYIGAPDPLISDMRRAAAKGAAGLESRERALVGEWGAAYVDVVRGGHVSQVAQAHAIAGPPSLERLDQAAVRVIAENLTEHDHLPDLLQRAGVTSPRAIEQLEESAAERVGSVAVQSGLPVADIIQRMGFTTPAAIRLLGIQGAQHDVAMGARVPDAVRAHGVEDIRAELELLAAQTMGRRLAAVGAPPAVIADRLGIQSPQVIAGLGRIAGAASPHRSTRDRHEAALVSQGGAAHQDILAGANVHEVSQRHGITHPARIGYLEELALQRLQNTYRASDHLPTLLAQAGVSSPHQIHLLEQTAAMGPGTSAVQRGAEPWAVAGRLGISSPAALHTLNLAAAKGEIALGLNAQQVMQDRQIMNADQRQMLEMWAVTSGGQRALDAGQPVEQVAQQLGVVDPAAMQALRGLAGQTEA